MDLNTTFHTHLYSHTPLKINNTPITPRIMGTGKCTALVPVGTLDVACPCLAGVFSWSKSATEAKCQRCSHPLQDHRDFSPELTLKKEPQEPIIEGKYSTEPTTYKAMIIANNFAKTDR